MNSPDIAADIHEDEPTPERQPLYAGDTGELPEEARRLLVQLLIGPSLDGRRHGRLWPALLRHESVIRSRLADLFLELVLDADAQVAFLRQADTGDLDAPILLRRTRLTFLESVLMLYLRQLLAEADLRGERAVVSRGEMEQQMQLYERSLNTDHAGFERRVNSAIEKVKKNSLISAIRASEERYEISPTLKLLFGAEEVAALAGIYQAAQAPDAEDAD
ncbi:MAG TPA: DUF4194 domain-containing protein [Gammaproteobacteria bacterium]|nr:DUF4194 domain-containing protein [Gammaproteobacteria bacterium]